MIEIEIADQQKTVALRRGPLRRLVNQVLKAESVTSARIVLAFVNNETIHQVNRDYLQHDYPTDVLTFPYESPGDAIHGEIVISTEFAATEAPRYGHTTEQEMVLYVIHGLLHLVGYDDHKAQDARKMKRRQEELLGEWTPPAPKRRSKGSVAGESPTRIGGRSVKTRPKSPRRSARGPA